MVKHVKYTKTNEYKLLQIGYSLDETEVIEKKLNSSQIDKLLNSEYDGELINYINEKYFIYSNYDKYLEYKKKNKSYDTHKFIRAGGGMKLLPDDQRMDRPRNVARGRLSQGGCADRLFSD